MLHSAIIIVIGILSSYILFYKFPVLKTKKTDWSQYKLSVIIPARNEEETIRLLLQDLMAQKTTIHEIICVDDASTDKTLEVATSFGVRTISIKDKPKDWTGKSWACQKGAMVATGDMLLFLDADVRLSPNAISTLLDRYHENKCVISVQPYHHTEKYYEQFSFFFNLIQIAGNGISVWGKPKNMGLYGPVILIDQKTYLAIDRHSAAKTSVVDDVVLGEKLKQMGFPFKLFLGSKDISFRMYGDDFKSLYQGWIKNYATGALKSDPFIFCLVFLWVTSCLSSSIFFVQSLTTFNMGLILLATCFCFLWLVELFRLSSAIGRFKKTTVIFYPVYLVFFVLIFSISLLKKIFKVDVVWKDRKIKLEK